MQNDTAQQGLKPKSLGVSDIVFFVIAAAAPLGATLGAGPVVFAMGGAGAPGIYLIASLVLLLFAIGFAAMSRHVISAGGFAELVSHGLGRPAGNAAGGIALLAYIAMLAGIYGQFAAFGAELASSFAGMQVDWRIVALLIIGLVGVFGYLDVKVSAKVLGVLMIFEILILVIFDVAVIAQTDIGKLSWNGFLPSQVFTPGLGVALMFAFCCFVGFESTTLYGEEAKNPNRTVPLATYVAIAIIGIFYTFTTWSIGLAYANSDVQAIAGADMVNFVFNANTQYVGSLSTEVMKLLVVSSVFAVLLSFHNALSRYLFALARSHFVPKPLSRVHPKHASPHVASLTLSIATALVVGAFMVANSDPIQHLYMWMVGLGTLAILALQTLGAAAVVGFTVKTKKCSSWQGVIAPTLGGGGLAFAVFLAVKNFSELTGTKEGLATYLPWLVLIAAVLGLLNGYRAKDKLHATNAAS
ncbi:APC family permease [Pseudomonas sp. NY15374]|uniref:APC family permease n=1 Tax=Pseudomonas sp. NY15374 TaxID=3400357 RepID=UPI003A8B8473